MENELRCLGGKSFTPAWFISDQDAEVCGSRDPIDLVQLDVPNMAVFVLTRDRESHSPRPLCVADEQSDIVDCLGIAARDKCLRNLTVVQPIDIVLLHMLGGEL